MLWHTYDYTVGHHDHVGSFTPLKWRHRNTHDHTYRTQPCLHIILYDLTVCVTNSRKYIHTHTHTHWQVCDWYMKCLNWHLKYLHDIWFTYERLNHSFYAWMGKNFYCADISIPYGHLIFQFGHWFCNMDIWFPYFYYADIWLLYGPLIFLFGCLFY